MRERIVSEVAERELRNLRIERSDRKVIDVAAIPLPDGGRLYKYTDVTDSINMERALRERNEALMAADRLKSEFIANVSYEFRTPLNAIIGYAELLSRQYFGTLNEKQQEYSHGILDAAQALLLLISDVIDVAAIEAGYIKLDLKPIDVKDMLEASERLFQQRARMRSVALSLDTASELGEIVGDQQRLKQALSNLLSNALSAAPYGGTVTLRAKRQPLQLALAVEVSSGPTGEGSAIREQQHAGRDRRLRRIGPRRHQRPRHRAGAHAGGAAWRPGRDRDRPRLPPRRLHPAARPDGTRGGGELGRASPTLIVMARLGLAIHEFRWATPDVACKLVDPKAKPSGCRHSSAGPATKTTTVRDNPSCRVPRRCGAGCRRWW